MNTNESGPQTKEGSDNAMFDHIYMKINQIKEKHKKDKEMYANDTNCFSLNNYDLMKVRSARKVNDVFNTMLNNDSYCNGNCYTNYARPSRNRMVMMMDNNGDTNRNESTLRQYVTYSKHLVKDNRTNKEVSRNNVDIPSQCKMGSLLLGESNAFNISKKFNKTFTSIYDINNANATASKKCNYAHKYNSTFYKKNLELFDKQLTQTITNKLHYPQQFNTITN